MSSIQSSVSAGSGAAPVCKGIDVYHGDGSIEWSKVLDEGGCQFGFCKIGENTGLDPEFKANWARMGECGITRGCFFFFHPEHPVSPQYNFIVSALKSVGGLLSSDLPISIDIEIDGGASRETIIGATHNLAALLAAQYNRNPILYTYPAFAEEFLDDSFGPYDLWIADYTLASAPTIPAGWDTWRFWQYAGTNAGEHPGGLHPMAGCAGATLDISRYNGSHANLVAHYGL